MERRIAGIGSYGLTVLLLALATQAAGQHAVTTVAGGGPNGAKATQASIGQPMGMASDKTGNVYIVVPSSNRVYKLTPAGTLAVFAGTGAAGNSGDGGPAVNAELNGPQSVAVDPSGNVFIADTGNWTLREVDAKTGVIATPDYETMYIDNINRIFIDASGHVFLVDWRYCVVDEDVETANGIDWVKTVVGGPDTDCGFQGDGGPATKAQISNPLGIFVDGSGNVFLADTNNNVIREVIGQTGIIQTVAGNGTQGYSGDGKAATSAELNKPMGVWEDGSGNLFIADTGNNVVRKVASGKISTIAGNSKPGYGGDGGLAISATLNGPSGILLDANQNILIADELNSVIRQVASATKKIQTWAGNGRQSYGGDGGLATNAQLNSPASVAIDSVGNFYVADPFNNVVREVVAKTGDMVTVAGTGRAGYTGDNGPAAQAQLSGPSGVFWTRRATSSSLTPKTTSSGKS
jgi:sugar lactone lactonase YvrE